MTLVAYRKQTSEVRMLANRWLRRAGGRLTEAEALALAKLQAGSYRWGFGNVDFIAFRTPGGFARDFAMGDRTMAEALKDRARGFPFGNYGALQS